MRVCYRPAVAVELSCVIFSSSISKLIAAVALQGPKVQAEGFSCKLFPLKEDVSIQRSCCIYILNLEEYRKGLTGYILSYITVIADAALIYLDFILLFKFIIKVLVFYKAPRDMLNKHAIKLQCALCSNTKDFSNLALILEQGSIPLSYSSLDYSISARKLARSCYRFLQEEAVNSSNSIFIYLVSNIRSNILILDNNFKSNIQKDSLLNKAITRLQLGCFSI